MLHWKPTTIWKTCRMSWGRGRSNSWPQRAGQRAGQRKKTWPAWRHLRRRGATRLRCARARERRRAPRPRSCGPGRRRCRQRHRRASDGSWQARRETRQRPGRASTRTRTSSCGAGRRSRSDRRRWRPRDAGSRAGAGRASARESAGGRCRDRRWWLGGPGCRAHCGKTKIRTCWLLVRAAGAPHGTTAASSWARARAAVLTRPF